MSDFEALNNQFTSWLAEIGLVLSPKIALHDYRLQGQGRGVIALEDIAKGETLFRIPRGSVMAVDTDPDMNVKIGDQMGPWISLITYMMYADSDSSDHRWKPYFDMLPAEFNTPMFWTPTELDLLKGSAVLDKIGRKDAEEQFEEVVKPFFAANVGEGAASPAFGVDAFHRMGSLIMSYSFDVKPVAGDGAGDVSMENDEEDDDDDDDDDVEPVKAMVPLADMLNAHTRLFNANLCHSSGALEMRAVKKIPKGSQVYNTYGELPNSDLMRRYGYAESGGTEYDVVEISLQSLADAFGGEEDLMEALEPHQDSIPFYDDAFDIPASGEPDLAHLVMLLVLDAHANGSDGLPPVRRIVKNCAKAAEDAQLTATARDAWLKAIETRLAEYPAALVSEAKRELNPMPTDDVIVDRAAMAREVLLGEIRILLRSAEWAAGAEIVPIDKLLGKKRGNSDGDSSNKRRK